jgi:rhodanese-related sulfurtransferase
VKFFIDNIWLIALALLSGGALFLPTLQRGGARVSLLQATQMLNQGKGVILDIRDQDEFAAGHIRDARHIPLKDLKSRISELGKFKSKSVIVVCSSGAQSARAASQLKSAGFTEVYSLDGGLAAWRAQGLPTAK